MAKVKPDHSFERGGRTLTKWLWDAVHSDPAVRRPAVEALQAMQFGLPSVHTDFEDLIEPPRSGQPEAFERAVESAVSDPAFNGADFVRALAAHVTQSHDHWIRLNHARDAQTKRVDEKILQQLEANPSRGRKRTLQRRLGRAICGDTKFDQQKNDALLESAFLLTLFGAMGKAAILAPDAVRALLADRQHRYLALRTIEKAGPAAAEFLADLAPDSDAEVDPEVTDAVGAISAGDPQVVGALRDQLHQALAKASQVKSVPATEAHEFHTKFYGRGSGWGPAGALSHMGPAARTAPGIGPTVIPRLLALSRSPLPGQRAAAAAGALASCAAGAEPRVIHDVFTRLMELTQDHSWVAGRAIDAIGKLRAEPARSVARLVELFDSFEEFDPDMGYHGYHARVCDALAAFGADAAPALPRIIRELESVLAAKTQDHDEWPDDLVKAIKAMGPAAISAIPLLKRLRDSFKGREEQIDGVIRAIQLAS